MCNYICNCSPIRHGESPRLGYFFIYDRFKMFHLLRSIFYVPSSTLIHKTFIGRLCRVFSDVSHPNFDPVKLSEWIAARKFLAVEKIKLYTGVPSLEMDRHWHEFWVQKNAVLARNKKVKIYTRETRVRKTRKQGSGSIMVNTMRPLFKLKKE